MAPSGGDCSNAVAASGASQPEPVASHSGAAVGDGPGGTGCAMRRRQQRKRQEGRRVAWLSGLLVASRTHHTTGPSCPDCAMLAGRVGTLAQRLQKYEAIVDQAAAASAHLRPVQPVPTPVPAPMPAEPARHADAAHGTLDEEPTDMQVFAALATARLNDLSAKADEQVGAGPRTLAEGDATFMSVDVDEDPAEQDVSGDPAEASGSSVSAQDDGLRPSAVEQHDEHSGILGPGDLSVDAATQVSVDDELQFAAVASQPEFVRLCSNTVSKRFKERKDGRPAETHHKVILLRCGLFC